VITWTNNGIERYSRESTCSDSLKSPDWRLRAQALKDVATARLRVDAVLVAPLAQDPHVLVRRQSAYAMATLGNREFVPLLEALLLDAESSVRIAAADALQRLHGSKTPRRILDALEKDAGFQFKLVCFQTLGAMKDLSLPVLEEGLRSRNSGVREVSVRALYTLGKSGLLDQVEPSIRAVMLDPREECQIRGWAVDSLVGLRIEMNDRRRTQLLADLLGLLQDGSRSSAIRIHAATGLGHLAPLLAARQREQAVEHLGRAFLEYGDGCVRGDAAYGWRPIGNALLEFGPAGRMSLEQMRVQAKDSWLAWIAYEVMYSVQKVAPSFNLVPQGEAIRNHEKYAPRFPGWRSW
jgi:HEAT repeat protein